MSQSFRNILINSTLAFVSAFIMTTFVHEFGHFLSYEFLGAHPTLFHNYVQTQTQSLSIPAKIISAMAGPVISLIQGLVFGRIAATRKGNGISRLFVLWFSLLGFVNFFGYLVTTPFSTAGDTGKVAEMLGIGFAGKLGIALVGLVLLLWILTKVAVNFGHFIHEQNDRVLRAKYIYRIMFFPILIGSLVKVILAFPAPAVLSILYPATSSFVIMSSFPAILRSVKTQTIRPPFEDRIMKSMIVLAVCMILWNRILTLGIG